MRDARDDCAARDDCNARETIELPIVRAPHELRGSFFQRKRWRVLSFNTLAGLNGLSQALLDPFRYHPKREFKDVAYGIGMVRFDKPQ